MLIGCTKMAQDDKQASEIMTHSINDPTIIDRKVFGPELSDVIVTRLSIGGAYDTHAVAGLEMTELQQHHGQVVDEELRVHQGHGKLDNPMIVLILERPQVECVS